MYLLDANVFIQSSRAHYGIDFVPGFWDWLDQSFEKGLLRSIQPIGSEIAAGKDELSKWAAARPSLFVPMDKTCEPSLKTISTWATNGKFTIAAKKKFLSVADYSLVAYAHAHSLTVVTMETSEPNRLNKIKIPDACIDHRMDWTTPFEMLRAEKASFVLSLN